MNVREFLVFSDVCHDYVFIDLLLCSNLFLPLFLFLLKQKKFHSAAFPNLGSPQPSGSVPCFWTRVENKIHQRSLLVPSLHTEALFWRPVSIICLHLDFSPPSKVTFHPQIVVPEARRKVNVVLDKFWGRKGSCVQRGVEVAIIVGAFLHWDREEAYKISLRQRGSASDTPLSPFPNLSRSKNER